MDALLGDGEDACIARSLLSFDSLEDNEGETVELFVVVVVVVVVAADNDDEEEAVRPTSVFPLSASSGLTSGVVGAEGVEASSFFRAFFPSFLLSSSFFTRFSIDFFLDRKKEKALVEEDSGFCPESESCLDFLPSDPPVLLRFSFSAVSIPTPLFVLLRVCTVG